MILEEESNSAPIIRYVDLVLYQAIKEKASDIHFEPFEDDFKIRYRVDGALYEMAPPPQHLKQAIISRIKVMSALNIAETRLAAGWPDYQGDQRSSRSTCGFRPLPTAFGESVVLRVLDRANVNLDLETLEPDSAEVCTTTLQDTIVKPNGIFICTGPTGAGKTTTLVRVPAPSEHRGCQACSRRRIPWSTTSMVLCRSPSTRRSDSTFGQRAAGLPSSGPGSNPRGRDA